MFLLTSAGLTFHLAAVMYTFTPCSVTPTDGGWLQVQKIWSEQTQPHTLVMQHRVRGQTLHFSSPGSRKVAFKSSFLKAACTIFPPLIIVNIFSLSVFLQRWWRCCLLKQSTFSASIEEEAVVCLQAAWRSYREHRKFLQWRDSAITIQRSWRNCRHRRSLAALTVQSAWRGFRERKHYCQIYRAVVQLQVTGRGYLARLRWVEDDLALFSGLLVVRGACML